MSEPANKHDYLSTACCHGLHERCRKVCKFCGEPCKCPCHKNHSNTDIETDPKKVLDGINEGLAEFGIKPIPETLTQQEVREANVYLDAVRKQIDDVFSPYAAEMRKIASED